MPEAFFSVKCTKYRLAAGLLPDLLGELAALPDPLAALTGRVMGGRGMRGEDSTAERRERETERKT